MLTLILIVFSGAFSVLQTYLNKDLLGLFQIWVQVSCVSGWVKSTEERRWSQLLLISYFLIYSFELDDDFTAMYKGQFPRSAPAFWLSVFPRRCVNPALLFGPQFWTW